VVSTAVVPRWHLKKGVKVENSSEMDFEEDSVSSEDDADNVPWINPDVLDVADVESGNVAAVPEPYWSPDVLIRHRDPTKMY
jgi:hypothetical protein